MTSENNSNKDTSLQPGHSNTGKTEPTDNKTEPAQAPASASKEQAQAQAQIQTQTPPAATPAPTIAAADAALNRKLKRRRYMVLLALLVVLGVAAWLAYHFLVGRCYEETDDAYVTGNVIPVMPQVGGTVFSITAEDGDYVQAGDILVRLDTSDTAVALQSAEASLASTVRQVRGLYSNADYAQAQVKTSEVAYERALADYNRRQRLASSGAISSEELAHARDTLNSTKSSLEAAKHTQQTSWAMVNGTDLSNHPDVKAASAAVLQAYLNHARTAIRAPITGYIAKRSVQVGSHISANQTLLSIIALDEVWIDANFKETQLGEMRIGQPVDIVSDLYGSKIHYRGTVESLGIGTGSAFALLPAQNATGNWIKIVQRLPVRIRLEADNLDTHPLRIGLSTAVTVDLREQNGPLLPTLPLATPRFATSVYEDEMAQANALIERIITENAATDDAATQANNTTAP